MKVSLIFVLYLLSVVSGQVTPNIANPTGTSPLHLVAPLTGPGLTTYNSSVNAYFDGLNALPMYYNGSLYYFEMSINGSQTIISNMIGVCTYPTSKQNLVEDCQVQWQQWPGQPGWVLPYVQDLGDTTFATGALQVKNEAYVWTTNIIYWGDDDDYFNDGIPGDIVAEGFLYKGSLADRCLNPTAIYVPEGGYFVSASLVQTYNDPNIYIFGTGNFRDSDIYLARVNAAQIEDPTKWSYFTGISRSAPTWSSNQASSVPIIYGGVGELSFQYNCYTRGFLGSYFDYTYDHHKNVSNRVLRLVSAQHPWGPYMQASSPLLDSTKTYSWYKKNWGTPFGGAMVPDNGAISRTLYMTVSLLEPFRSFLLKLDLSTINFNRSCSQNRNARTLNTRSIESSAPAVSQKSGRFGSEADVRAVSAQPTTNQGNLTYITYLTQFNITGWDGDLAVPFIFNGKVWFIEGDCNSQVERVGNSLGYCNTTDLDKCHVIWNTIPAKNLPAPVPNQMFPVLLGQTTAPAGAITIGGVVYVYMFNVFSWGGFNGLGTVANSFLIQGNPITNCWSPTTVFWPPQSPFVNAAPALSSDGGTVYLFGSGSYRETGVYLAKVAVNSIANFNAYQYYHGMKNGLPVWSSSYNNIPTVVSGVYVGELSAQYNTYKGKYLMSFFNFSQSIGGDANMLIMEADYPYGPWTHTEVVFDYTINYPWFQPGWFIPGLGAIPYGGYMVPALPGQSGRYLYVTVSLYIPYRAFLLKLDLQTNLVKEVIPA